MSKQHLVMYSRSRSCPYISIAKRVLHEADMDYIEIHIDIDAEAKQRVLDWTGFESVPTLVMAPQGELLPPEDPAFLEPGASPRGVDRGYMITEPNELELKAWLHKHGFEMR